MFGCIRFRKAEEERFALRNGARILEHLIKSFNGECNPFRIFSEDEIATATNNYNETKLLHIDAFYKLYQGSHEGREICVKNFKARAFDRDWCENEVAVASQLSKHKNILKFLGCCLETQRITLVFEFAANGNLSRHLFGVLSPLSWPTRLRIATEIAEAVAYLHEGASKAIIHRQIMSKNIFLDQDLVVKIFEFGLSLPVPQGEEHVDAPLEGTNAYFPPEIITTGRFTDKSDVYDFGTVLLETFTGKRTGDIMRQLAVTRRDSMLCDRDEIDKEVELESCIINAMTMSDQGNDKQRMECAELIRRCHSLSPDQRPTIQEAAKKLKQIRLLD